MTDGMAPGQAHAFPLEFRGAAREYFGIWIVNLLLTLVTLGIWSAWAKVRRKRFFLGNTILDGSPFEYHAKPKQILLGRILVVIVLSIYSVLAELHIAVNIGILVAFVFLFPWVANRSLRFNARVTSWRNVRFDFAGDWCRAFINLVLIPAAGILTLGLLFPWATRCAARYVASGHRFGTAKFEANPPIGLFYRAALETIGVLFAMIAVIAAIGLIGAGVKTTFSDPLQFLTPFGIVGLFFSLIFALLIVRPYYRALVRNITVRSLTLDDGHRFASSMSAFRLAWIVVSNLIITLVTLGLMHPWALLRRYRYETTSLTMLAAGPLDTFVGHVQKAGEAFGAELVDLEGIEIGF